MIRKMKNKYNGYTEDFRREAVRRSENPDTSAAEVAKERGIHPRQIYNWRRQYKRLSDKQFNTVNGVDYSMEESEEIRKLKRQVTDLKEENEFLKLYRTPKHLRVTYFFQKYGCPRLTTKQLMRRACDCFAVKTEWRSSTSSRIFGRTSRQRYFKVSPPTVLTVSLVPA